MNIKKRFEELNFKEQIQLYGIVVICYILIFVFYEDIAHFLFPNTKQPVEKVSYKSVESQQIQYKRLSNIKLYKYLNRRVKQYHIDLVETKITQNNMKIEIRGKFDDILSFMDNYEQNFIIDSFMMEQIFDNTITLSLSVDIEKFDEKRGRKENKSKTINPFISSSSMVPEKTIVPQREIKDTKKHELVVTAIVGSEILVNNQWYTKNDIYKNFRIKEIRKKSVIFIDMQTNKKLKKGITNE